MDSSLYAVAGLYIHIPFCRKACHYCDFHFSVSHGLKERVISCIQDEIRHRSDFFDPKETVESIYFGGGTPSVLSPKELQGILRTIGDNLKLDPDPEITFEANPDDLDRAYLKELYSSGVNRLSIGLQSLDDHLLEWMNRSHTAEQGVKSAENAVSVGFDRINVDLIYGVPGQTDELWLSDLKKVLSWPIDHLSAYSLTMEPRTYYANSVKKGLSVAPDDQQASSHYHLLQERLINSDWKQYEVSNYCRDQRYSVHNSNYWKQQKYLGIGPSAHSFNGKTRMWNVASNAAYVQQVEARNWEFESEDLDRLDQINELIMMGLRTVWGLDLKRLEELGYQLSPKRKQVIDRMLENGWGSVEGSIH